MVKLSYVLIKANHIAQVPYSLSHRRNNPIVLICPGEKGKQFFEMLNINSNYKNVHPVTFEEYQTRDFEAGSVVFILHAPTKFQILQEVLNRGQSQSHSVILSLLEESKKYINMINKKIAGLDISETAYSPNKFVGINDKIRDFVDQSYDMNRAAFYAYGEYINFLRANLLKKIFRTELIKLDDLARSFGFPSAQRVKEGTFLKPSAQQATKTEKRKKRKQVKNTKPVQQQEVAVQQQQKVKVKKTKKITKDKVKKSVKAK